MINIAINMDRTGDNIKTLMDSRGLNVVMVQDACGLSCPQSVYKWLHGKSVPSVDNLGILRELFDVTVDDILVYDDLSGEGGDPYDRTNHLIERLAG